MNEGVIWWGDWVEIYDLMRGFGTASPHHSHGNMCCGVTRNLPDVQILKLKFSTSRVWWILGVTVSSGGYWTAHPRV